MLKDLISKVSHWGMTEVQRGHVTNQTQAEALKAADALRDFSSTIVEKFVAADETASDVNSGTPGSVFANLNWKQPHAREPERFDVRHRWEGSLNGQNFEGSGTHIVDPKGPVNCDGSPTLHECRLTQKVEGNRTEIHLREVEQFEFSAVVHEEWAVFDGDKVSYRSKSR